MSVHPTSRTTDMGDYTQAEAHEYIRAILAKPGRRGSPELGRAPTTTPRGVTCRIHLPRRMRWSAEANTYRELVHEVAKDAFRLWPSDDERADHDAHAARLRKWARAAQPEALAPQCGACDGVEGAPLCERCQQLASEGRL